MMITGILITVRTARQGAYMEKGKFSPEYEQEISTLAINPDDLALLELSEGNKALVESSSGQVEVICKKAEGPRGIFFLPLGAIANKLLGSETSGTGVPEFKNIPVSVQQLS
ncbi:MAG: hypothetical protein APF84_01465 [Gracilibacter sp. BRH_c7a]|nr:MAG: hypothetical protein APF84_01465 [Gracilibacter sp. BRH_c7a]